MLSPRTRFALPTGCAAMLLAGCMPTMTCQDIQEMRPPRAPELDRLKMFVGEWETEGEVRIPAVEAILRTVGHNSADWMLDGRMVVEHAELDMGELGKISGMSVWTWDSAIRKYRMFWFDSLGEVSIGTATFDAKTETWHITAKAQKFGYRTIAKGTLRRIDANTIEWTWREYLGLGLFKVADMNGVSRRKP